MVTGRQAGCAEVRGYTGRRPESATGRGAAAARRVQNLGDVARPDRSGEWAIAAGLSLYPLAAKARAEAAA